MRSYSGVRLSGTFFGLAVLASPLAAAAATLSGTLGEPGVVWVSDGSRPAVTTGAVLTQKDKAFAPDLTVVTAGSDVRFRNDDQVDHSVYSISPADPFDLGIYEPGPGKDVSFPNPGIVDVRCHIHRRMHATLIVVDGPFARVEAAGGSWRLDGVRPGRHVLHLWTPHGGEVVRVVRGR